MGPLFLDKDLRSTNSVSKKKLIDTFSLVHKLILSGGMRSKLELILVTGRDAILAIGTQKHVYLI